MEKVETKFKHHLCLVATIKVVFGSKTRSYSIPWMRKQLTMYLYSGQAVSHLNLYSPKHYAEPVLTPISISLLIVHAVGL